MLTLQALNQTRMEPIESSIKQYIKVIENDGRQSEKSTCSSKRRNLFKEVWTFS